MQCEIKPKSLKLNAILSIIRTLLNVAIPLLIFPYVSRVLGPENIGKVEFANSVENYFILFAALGIPAYGIREIARVRNNKDLLSKTISELTVILIITNLICCITYVCIFFTGFSKPNDKLLYIVIFPNILLSSFNYEWFYSGIEDQVYITIRYIIIRLLQILAIFILIKQKDDYIFYAIIFVGMNGLSSIFNIIRLPKYVSPCSIFGLDIIRHIKPIFITFSSIIAVSIYVQLDVTMVGIIVDDKAVGLYTTANKIIRVIISIVTSLGTVMIPRLANNLATGNIIEYKNNLYKSFNFILMFSLPFVFGIIATADDLILLFAGHQFSDSAFSMQLLSPIIVIVGLAHFIGLQLLYANKKEIIYTISVSMAALINLIFNYVLIPIYRQNGAVVGTIIAETSGLLFMCILGKNYIKNGDFLDFNIIWYLVASFIMFALILIEKHIFRINMCFQILSGIIFYGLLIFPFVLRVKKKGRPIL